MSGRERRAWLADLVDQEGFVTASPAVADLRAAVQAFVRAVVDDAGAERVVVGLDGGRNTTVVAALAADALGADRVTGLVMPAHMITEASARDAEALATSLGIEYERIQLQPVVAAFQEAIGANDGPADDLAATERALSRIRTACAYYVADTTNAVVVGAATRTTLLTGAAVGCGETETDCLPLGDLYGVEVRALADALGVPDDLVGRSAGGGFGVDAPGSAVEGESARTVDRTLRLAVDEGLDASSVAGRVGVDVDTVERLVGQAADVARRRSPPPTPATRTARCPPELVDRPINQP